VCKTERGTYRTSLLSFRRSRRSLLALGLAWTRLSLSAVASRFAFWPLVYSTFAILAAYVLGAFWGAGNETIPMAAGVARGSPVQENAIKLVAIRPRRTASSPLR
jgi:hypothetical protein